MEWLISHKSKKGGYAVSLPDHIVDGEPFHVKVDGVAYKAIWRRSAEVLSLVPEGGGAERIYASRTSSIESYDDEPEVAIDMEYRSPSEGITGFSGALEIHIPGLKHKKSSEGSQGAVLRAPMAGKVLKVLVASGDKIEKGETVCVIEAMKMENQIGAPQSGIVDQLAIKEGDQLGIRDKMLIIKNK